MYSSTAIISHCYVKQSLILRICRESDELFDDISKPLTKKYSAEKSFIDSTRHKSELCRQYYESGSCEYGLRCHFAHGTHELNNTRNRHRNYKTKECTAYMDFGYCAFGTRCAFVHSKLEPLDIIERVLSKYPKVPMPENPDQSSECPQFFPSSALVREVNREMDLDNRLMPSQFIKSNYQRLPTFKRFCQ